VKFKLIILLLFFISNVIASVSEGPYIGLEAGLANQNTSFNQNILNLNLNGSTINNYSYGLLARLNLGYNGDKYNGFELGTNYYFSTSHSYPVGNSNLNTNALTLDASYILNLPTAIEKLSIFGRVGVAYDWINIGNQSCNCNTSSNLQNGSGLADILGAGIKYNISPKTSFRLEWLSNGLIFPVAINNSFTNIANWNAQTFQLGINYHF